MGRSRSFDIDAAIQTATELFWRQGYERTSLADLTAAMGITPPSFYFAFESKEALFERVVRHYIDTRLAQTEIAYAETTARGFAQVMLYRLAELYTDKTCPPGCLLVNNALPSDQCDGTIRATLSSLREQRRKRLKKQFKTYRDKGSLPANADPDDLAHYLMMIGWGMAHAAQSGASRAELKRSADRALLAWA